jgi:hypothetical protein
MEEENDLSEEHPEVLEKITSAFSEWQAEMSNAEPRGPFKDF